MWSIKMQVDGWGNLKYHQNECYRLICNQAIIMSMHMFKYLNSTVYF